MRFATLSERPLRGYGTAVLAPAPMSRPQSIILDDGPAGQALSFSAPAVVITAHAADDVGPALDRMGAALAAGKYLAGYFSYELGYVLEPRLRPLLPVDRRVPLLWFGVFDAPARGKTDDLLAANVDDRAYAGPLGHEWGAEAYARQFARVHRYIGDGDIYQANLSFRSHFHFAGEPAALYRRLRRTAATSHGAYVQDGDRHILSLSPELFFQVSSAGEIIARPMKGTAPRGSDPASDAAAREALRRSEKDRAENLMIVDLLRNDLGRIAEIGSIEVGDLFTVETYPTLHTMVSSVHARLQPGWSPRSIVRALFPCGSITGAPKIRAMEVIHDLEASPRGLYCGAIGFFAPDGAARFNVAIRTLTITGSRGELGIGGAIVQDSRVQDEYDECLLKARYFERAREPIGLIETLAWRPDKGFVRLERHLARMAASAAVFGLPFREASARSLLRDTVAGCREAQRIRLVLDEAGAFGCTKAVLGPPQAHWTYALVQQPVSSRDLLLRHKTTWRDHIDRATRQVAADEVIFLNETGAITEGGRSNIFVRKGGKLLTPSQSAGLLPGILRQEMLETGECREAYLTAQDLATADEVLFGNSLRGLVRGMPLAMQKSVVS